ncbi:MAG: hypothetical protein PHU30_06975 [Oscillospiraceae bacterium]|nr:hypothetical protein [Oscillospiraceae bacterium]
MDCKQHKKSTFLVEVQFQQNSTWQGSIHWLEEKKSQHFRSSLEMMKLMEDALTDGEESDSDIADHEPVQS